MRILLAVALITSSLCLRAQTKSILLHNATIIDVTKENARHAGSLLIEEGVIKRIAYGQKQIKADTVIDCTGKFICPGLIDAHVHLATLDLTDVSKATRYTDSVVANMLRHGITSVRDMAGNASFLQTYHEAELNGTKKMPSIFYAAQFAGPAYFKMINQGSKQTEGLHPWSKTITDTTDIALAVKQAKQMGVTGIKIYAELSPALVQAITKEAHRQGLQAWSHVAIAPALPSDAINASVNSMSHANDFLFEQFPANEDRGKVWSAIYKGLKADSVRIYPLLQSMKRKNIILDATVFSASNNKLQNALLVTGWAHNAGVMIDAGTDWVYPTTGNVPLLDEMQTLVSQCGMSHADVICSATLIGAKAIGLSDRGVIQKEKRADILILANDPAIDLASLFHPEIVMQKGEIKFTGNAN